DFDESLLAPCTWDLTRLATSALIAAKQLGLKRKPAAELCDAFLNAYTLSLRDGKARWIERATAQGLIKSLLQGLQRRTRSAFIAFVKQLQPRWKSEAERVVAVEQRMQAISPALLHALSLGPKSYVLRELMPTQDKLDLHGWNGECQLDRLARDLAFLVGWSE